ncbi:hypothetical protein WA026_013515 [Henosepilachna vigintioctopunctata]|uniref:Secreted protein n=1 Tax=Henosepilachna vigintioctopunctata TaxID=420089 RepID=A0AAW1VEA2_9CUCU
MRRIELSVQRPRQLRGALGVVFFLSAPISNASTPPRPTSLSRPDYGNNSDTCAAVGGRAGPTNAHVNCSEGIVERSYGLIDFPYNGPVHRPVR